MIQSEKILVALNKSSERVIKELTECKVVGLGSGRTISYILKKIKKKLKKDLVFVPSSKQIELIASRIGLRMVSPDYINSIDLTIDGADEVDFRAYAIKGGGGALLTERLLAFISRRYILVVDESKLSRKIGLKSRVPVEFIPSAYPLVKRVLENKKLDFIFRLDDKGYPKLSESGNYLFDVRIMRKSQPEQILDELRKIPGVVDVGIFLKNEISKILVGKFNGEVIEIKGGKQARFRLK